MGDNLLRMFCVYKALSRSIWKGTLSQSVRETHTYLNAGVALGQVGISAGACWAQLGLQVGAGPRLTENRHQADGSVISCECGVFGAFSEEFNDSFS